MADDSGGLRDAVIAKMTMTAMEHYLGIYAKSAGIELPAKDDDDDVPKGDALFALLVDTAYAYVAYLETEALDPDQPLFAVAGMSPLDGMFKGLEENLEQIKSDNPGAMPVNGWVMWRKPSDPSDGS